MTESLNATETLGATGATHPRVTLADIELAIAGENYFTAGAAALALGQEIPLPGESSRAGYPIASPLHLLTICVLTMKNGFIEIGHSAPASPENFDIDKGRQFARENAIRALWPKMGFALRDRLSTEV